MAETEAPQSTQQNQNETTTTKKSLNNVSFSIWPPTQRTRDAVTNRLIETLSSPSVLSKRYGIIPHKEATDLAKIIEEEAFAFAASSASADDDGIEILQVYSKEISKRMLDSVKSRSDLSATTAASTPVEEEKKVKEDYDAEEKKVKEESAAEEAATGDAVKSEE